MNATDYTATAALRHGGVYCTGCASEAFPTRKTVEPKCHIVRDPHFLNEVEMFEHADDDTAKWIVLLCSRHLQDAQDEAAEDGAADLIRFAPLTVVLDRLLASIR